MSAPTYTDRQVLAFIAMAAAPVPSTVALRDGGDMELSFHGPGASAKLRRWMTLLHSTEGMVGPNLSADCSTLVSHHLWPGSIGGRRVVMWAHEPAGPGTDELLGGATRDEMQQLVDEEPRCPTCGEPERLLASGAVGHAGDEHGNPCPTEDVVDQVVSTTVAELKAVQTAWDETFGGDGS